VSGRADLCRPEGPEAVRSALIQAARALLLEEGTAVSVRAIAKRAGVNHGLVHTYFGSKQALIVAALDDINERAASEITPDGYPPADLARRRGGELGRAIARLSLDEGQDLFSSHPIFASWRAAVERDNPDLPAGDVVDGLAAAAALALGWAVFGDQICASLTEADREHLDEVIASETERLGYIPPRPCSGE